MKVYYTPQNFTATPRFSTPPGYEASNLENTSISLPWRSVDTEIAHGFELTLDTPIQITGVMFYGMNVYTSVTSNTLTFEKQGGAQETVNNIPIIRDPLRRHKAFFAPFQNGYTDLYEKIIFVFGGDPGNPYWEVGSAYIWRNENNVIRNPAYNSRVQTVYPAIAAELANGARPYALSGAPHQRLTLDFDQHLQGSADTTYAEILLSYLLNGPIGIDLEHEDYEFWPLTYNEFGFDSSYASYGLNKSNISLRELVTL